VVQAGGFGLPVVAADGSRLVVTGSCHPENNL
jgi:hypothetical protein